MRDLAGRFLYVVVVPVVIVVLVFITYRQVFAPQKVEDTAVSRTNESVKDLEEDDEPVLPDVEVDKPEITHFVDGVVNWTVTAESISVDAESGEARLLESQGIFVRDEDHGLSFKAPVTVYDTRSRNVKLEGDIEARLVPEEHEIQAKEISWDESTGVLVANEVKVAMDGGHVTGGWMELRYGEKKVAFDGGVLIEMPVNKRNN